MRPDGRRLAGLPLVITLAACDGDGGTVNTAPAPSTASSTTVDPVAARRHRAVPIERRLLLGEGWQDHDLVFCGPAGEPLHPDSVSRTFDRRARKAGVAHIRFHDPRHSHCANLIAARPNPTEISRRLGHASVSFTLDWYAHLMPDAGAQAAAAVAALVDGARR